MSEVELTIEEESRGPGRPRDPSIDEAVLKVALRQMAKVGYSRMTLDGVAAEAGVTKPAIYRRWSSKADLATAALARLRIDMAPVPSGDSRADLVAVLRAFLESLRKSNGMSMVGTMLAEEQHMPEFMRLFRERVVTPRRQLLREALSRGIAAGQVKNDVDIDGICNMLIGSFHARHLTGEPLEDNWPDRVVAVLWTGIGTSV